MRLGALGFDPHSLFFSQVHALRCVPTLHFVSRSSPIVPLWFTLPSPILLLRCSAVSLRFALPSSTLPLRCSFSRHFSLNHATFFYLALFYFFSNCPSSYLFFHSCYCVVLFLFNTFSLACSLPERFTSPPGLFCNNCKASAFVGGAILFTRYCWTSTTSECKFFVSDSSFCFRFSVFVSCARAFQSLLLEFDKIKGSLKCRAALKFETNAWDKWLGLILKSWEFLSVANT